MEEGGASPGQGRGEGWWEALPAGILSKDLLDSRP